MIEPLSIIDENLIQDISQFKDILTKRKEDTNIKIEFNMFTLDSCKEELYKNNLLKYESLLQTAKQKELKATIILLSQLKEYLSIREIYLTNSNKTINHTKYVYTLF